MYSCFNIFYVPDLRLFVSCRVQKYVVKETYQLKKGMLQWRAARKWLLFVTSLKHFTLEQRVAMCRQDLDEVASWSDLPFPITSLVFKAFLW